jgi:hypothetical protein
MERMEKKTLRILTVISAIAWAGGYVFHNFYPDNDFIFSLYFFGWISFMLVVGYSSTPSSSLPGKVAFACVVVMILGIVMKILHMPGANIIIVVGLLGIGLTYFVMWFGKKT